MDCQKALALVNNFVADERYPLATVYNKNHHIFDVLDLKETALSGVIAWLLGPDEGHGLGDYFIKALLLDATADSDVDFPLKSLEIDQLKLQQLKLLTEHALPDRRRIDILATDIDNRLIIIIEHKYGGPENNNQLAAYSTWAESIIENNPEYRLARILMDGHGRLQRRRLQQEEQSKWAMVTHQWLIHALDRVVDSASLPSSVNWILKDLLIHLDSRHELDNDVARAADVLAGMVKDHHELVENYASIEVVREGGETANIYDCDDLKFIHLHSTLSGIDADHALQLHKFLQKNWALLSSLSEYAKLDWIQESLEKSYPDRFEFEIDTDSTTSLSIFQNSWQKFKQREQISWPFYLVVEDVAEEGHYHLKIMMQKNGLANEAVAGQMAVCFDQKLPRNWSEKELADNVVDTSLESDNTLLFEIEGMLERINTAISRIQQ